MLFRGKNHISQCLTFFFLLFFFLYLVFAYDSRILFFIYFYLYLINDFFAFLLFYPHRMNDKRTCARAHSKNKWKAKQIGSRLNGCQTRRKKMYFEHSRFVLKKNYCVLETVPQSKGEKNGTDDMACGTTSSSTLRTKLRFLYSDVAKIARHVLFTQRPQNSLILLFFRCVFVSSFGVCSLFPCYISFAANAKCSAFGRRVLLHFQCSECENLKKRNELKFIPFRSLDAEPSSALQFFFFSAFFVASE